MVFFEFDSQSLNPTFLMLTLFLIVSLLSFVGYYVWYPAIVHLLNSYSGLILTTNGFFRRCWITVFFWSFLAPCALFTNNRLHPTVWVFLLLLLKNFAYNAQSLIADLMVIFFISLLFEHLLFAFLLHSVDAIKAFFIDIFGSELLFFCLGNMWKDPAKKVTLAGGLIAWDMFASHMAEEKGTIEADKNLSRFPGSTSSEQWFAIKTEVADKWYSRYGVNGQIGTIVKTAAKFFEE